MIAWCILDSSIDMSPSSFFLVNLFFGLNLYLLALLIFSIRKEIKAKMKNEELRIIIDVIVDTLNEITKILSRKKIRKHKNDKCFFRILTISFISCLMISITLEISSLVSFFICLFLFKHRFIDLN